MRRPALGFASAAVLLAFAPPVASAQECTGGGRYVVWVRPSQINFPTPTAADFDAGWLEAPPAEVAVNPRGNSSRGWELCLRAESATMGGYGKPVSDIQFRHDGTGTWTPISTVSQLLATGDRRRRVALQFRVALDWTRDIPGQYRSDFTATAARD